MNKYLLFAATFLVGAVAQKKYGVCEKLETTWSEFFKKSPETDNQDSE